MELVIPNLTIMDSCWPARGIGEEEEDVQLQHFVISSPKQVNLLAQCKNRLAGCLSVPV